MHADDARIEHGGVDPGSKTWCLLLVGFGGVGQFEPAV